MTVQRGRTRPPAPWWASICIGAGSGLMVVSAAAYALVHTLT